MTERVTIAHADDAIARLKETADYAAAERGALHFESLTHYVPILTDAIAVAAVELKHSKDAALPIRDRDAYQAHSEDIARAIVEDVDTLHEKYRARIARITSPDKGLRGVLGVSVEKGVMTAESMWGGRFTLGAVTCTSVAKKSFEEYRKLPKWVVWGGAGVGGVAAAGAVAGSMLGLFPG